MSALAESEPSSITSGSARVPAKADIPIARTKWPFGPENSRRSLTSGPAPVASIEASRSRQKAARLCPSPVKSLRRLPTCASGSFSPAEEPALAALSGSAGNVASARTALLRSAASIAARNSPAALLNEPAQSHARSGSFSIEKPQ